MKKLKIVILLFICSMLYLNSYSLPTQLSGSLSGTYGTTGNSPDYIVIADIYVTSGNNVTFDPGVTVEFGNNGTTGYKFDIQTSAYLTALGTSSQIIQFYPSNQTIGWGGINFYGSIN